jgi:hypothetical protein
MSTITEQLEIIGDDILMHLTDEKRPLTQKELYDLSDLGLTRKNAGLSDYGWPFALLKLERAGKVEMIGDDRWKLTGKLITKKELKECSHQNDYKSRALGIKRNVIWFGWKSGEYEEDGIGKVFAGYKYAVFGMNGVSKKVVFDTMYEWLTTGKPPFTKDCEFRYAETDKKRFKVRLSL